LVVAVADTVQLVNQVVVEVPVVDQMMAVMVAQVLL
jgi:hypothetical protein